MNKIGELAFWDTSCGMIPCKVLSVREDPTGKKVKIRLTASRGAYKKGEVREESTFWVVPRGNVRRHKNGIMIIGGWNWV